MRFQRARIRLSYWRQRIILTLRWWFRLPIDDLKEMEQSQVIDGLIQLNQQATQSIERLVNALNYQNAKLAWYEKNIPRMGNLKKQFEREQEKIRIQANGDQREMQDRLDHGIVGALSS